MSNGDYWDSPAVKEVEREIAEKAAQAMKARYTAARKAAADQEVAALRQKLHILQTKALRQAEAELPKTTDRDQQLALVRRIIRMQEALGYPVPREYRDLVR